MEDLAARAVQMARARHPGRPEVARAVSLRIQAGDVPAHVIAAAMGYDFSAGLTVADMLAGPEVRKDMSLAAFIDSVAQTLPAVAPAAAPYGDSELIERESAKPVQRQAAQEAAILGEIRRLGLDPRLLPAVPKGKPCSTKATVRAALPAWSDAVFDKAWKRLTGDGRIERR